MKKFFIFFCGCLNFLSLLNAQDYIDRIPELNKVWGPKEYEKTLIYLKTIEGEIVSDFINKNLRRANYYPSLSEKKDSIFYARLFSHSNLDFISDTSLSFEERFVIVSQYFNIFQDYLNLFEAHSNLKNEALVFTIFMLEMTKRTNYLIEEIMIDATKARIDKFKNNLANSMYKVISGTLSMLENYDNNGIDRKYIVSSLEWLRVNLVGLYKWLNEEGRIDIKNRFHQIYDNTSDVEIKKLSFTIYNSL